MASLHRSHVLLKRSLSIHALFISLNPSLSLSTISIFSLETLALSARRRLCYFSSSQLQCAISFVYINIIRGAVCASASVLWWCCFSRLLVISQISQPAATNAPGSRRSSYSAVQQSNTYTHHLGLPASSHPPPQCEFVSVCVCEKFPKRKLYTSTKTEKIVFCAALIPIYPAPRVSLFAVRIRQRATTKGVCACFCVFVCVDSSRGLPARARGERKGKSRARTESVEQGRKQGHRTRTHARTRSARG